MKKKQPLRNPNIEQHLVESVEDELYALRSFATDHWYLVLILLFGIGLFLYAVRPFPPRTVTIATGQPQSAYEDLGKRYQAFFQRNGVELKVVPTNGPLDNVELLAKRGVDAAFSVGGIPVPTDRDIVSLGSIQFEPLWLFYRGAPFVGDDALEFLAPKKLSIGPNGSATRQVVLNMLKEHRLDVARQSNLVESTAQDAAAALRAGRIDGMFLLAGMESTLLAQLLEDPELNLWNFRTAKAIAGRIPHMYAVVYPMGAASLSPVRPVQDVNLLATNTKVLVRDDLHPAIQYLFMMAGRDFHDNTHFYFDRPEGFPVFLDHDVKKSDVAVKYFEHHSTALERTFPFWVASFLDRAWLLLAALVAVVLPLARLVPEYRKLHFRFDVENRYEDIERIEHRLRAAAEPEDVRRAEAAFGKLEQDVAGMWVPTGLREKYYMLVNATEILRTRIAESESKVGSD
jgi:hypothetical protein